MRLGADIAVTSATDRVTYNTSAIRLCDTAIGDCYPLQATAMDRDGVCQLFLKILVLATYIACRIGAYQMRCGSTPILVGLQRAQPRFGIADGVPLSRTKGKRLRGSEILESH
jgi:hypothetical protein